MPYLNKITPEPEPIDCRILTAALDLFVTHGFHSVSIHDVQKQAKVSMGSIYNYFGGKEGVAKALYEHLLLEFEEMFAGVAAERISSREKCNLIIRLLFGYTETRPHIMAYMLQAKHRPFLPDELPTLSTKPFANMRDIVRQGMANGEIRHGQLSVVTSMVFGGALQLMRMRLDRVVAEPLPTLYDEVVAHVWATTSPDQPTPMTGEML